MKKEEKKIATHINELAHGGKRSVREKKKAK